MKRKKPIPRVLIIAFGVGILALALTLARDSETEGKDTGPQVEVSPVSGSSRSSPAASEAILRVPALEPGGKTSASVRVRNSGDAPGLFLLSLGDGPPPAEGLELTVADVTGRGSQKTVYTGGTRELGTRPLGVLDPGSSRTYRLTATASEAQTPSTVTLRWKAIEGLYSGRRSKLLRTPDTTPPQVRLVLEPQQPVTESSRLSAELRCSELCRATADATTPPDDTPVPVTIDGVAGEPRTRHPLAIVFPEQVRSYLLDEVEAGRSVPITVRLTAIDETGRTAERTETVTLRPPE